MSMLAGSRKNRLAVTRLSPCTVKSGDHLRNSILYSSVFHLCAEHFLWVSNFIVLQHITQCRTSIQPCLFDQSVVQLPFYLTSSALYWLIHLKYKYGFSFVPMAASPI